MVSCKLAACRHGTHGNLPQIPAENYHWLVPVCPTCKQTVLFYCPVSDESRSADYAVMNKCPFLPLLNVQGD